MPDNANVVLHQLTASLHPAADGPNKPAMSERPPPAIFDRKLYAVRRARAAPSFDAFDFLHRRAMSDIVQRLEIVKRDFPRALFYGAGELTSLISETCGVGEITHADLSRQRLTGAGTKLVYDEEFAPLAPHSFDLIVSVLTLHHANDLVGALAQMRHALKPDGLMLAVMFGEETLAALRQALYAAETEISGGVSARIAPFAAVRDLGAALQRAGFALPVADVDRVEIAYRDPARLFADLRGMGETSVLARRAKSLRRAVLGAAVQRLADGPPVRFDLVTLTGWAPHESQQKPARRGSATHSLAAAVAGEINEPD